ncbi:MAG: TetR/AcrR family transcriptional regulator [Thermodesulfobacteriota bacterium]|nr:TetR/AcrR family transcriptional regulator [Thermodesulfobacteriota bacterium]
MPTPLEKVKSQPDSMKARIFAAAQKLFAQYGYEGTTTRMIAAEVGIDISTLYYHWGEKKELYLAVLENFDNEIGTKLKEIEAIVHGKSLHHRLDVAIEEMCNYLFENIEVTRLILFSSFLKSKDTTDPGVSISEYISNVAVAMGMAMDKSSITPTAKARVMAMVLSLFSFISGETFLRPILDVDPDHYIAVVKETLKFILIPAFTQQTGDLSFNKNDSQADANNSAITGKN